MYGYVAKWKKRIGLNAPFGARCFLTGARRFFKIGDPDVCLNAPFGARCFLTGGVVELPAFTLSEVLMHLLALGAL